MEKQEIEEFSKRYEKELDEKINKSLQDPVNKPKTTLARIGEYPADFEIQASNDGKKWSSQALFWKGQKSRIGLPFDNAIAIRELESFKLARHGDYKYARLIITI